MIPEQYFPLASEQFGMTMGTRPIEPHSPLIHIDVDCIKSELELKRTAVDRNHDEYCLFAPGTIDAQWESLDLILSDLTKFNAGWFSLEKHGREISWRNKLSGNACHFEPGVVESLPVQPLEWIGLQIQEDLCLLDSAVAGIPLVGGLVCFPGDWRIGDKLNRSFVDVHSPVPLFDRIARPSTNLMERLKPGRPVWRPNWGGVKPTAQLDLTPQHSAWVNERKTLLTAENIGRELYFRVERQTLSPLTLSNHVLFTIHTYVARMEEIASNRTWARNTLGWLTTAPPEWITYKGLNMYFELLTAYLTSRITNGRET